MSGVTCEIPPSKGGRDGTSLNVGCDIVGKKPEHAGLVPHDVHKD